MNTFISAYRTPRGAFLGSVLLLVLAPLLQAAQKNCKDTWHDSVRGKFGVLRIDYDVCSRDKQTFKVYRNKDWNGNNNTWERLEEFALSSSHPTHEKKYPQFYNSVAGPIEVEYSLRAEYDKSRVHCKGYVKYPNTNAFPIAAETKRWDQYFTGIPSADDVAYLPPGTKDYVEISEIWTAFCSDLSCGPWVRFKGYSEAHRYGVRIPGISVPVIIQLWKGYCPRYNRIEEKLGTNTRALVNIGKNFPGGLGAEVGVYVPRSGKTMLEAALTRTPIGDGEWKPLVNSNIKISFQLVNKTTGQVVVDAPEKQSWWRTKWKNIGDPLKEFGGLEKVLNYELRYSINGVQQPSWGYSGEEGYSTGVGRYPEIGFNGIWKRQNVDPLTDKLLEIYYGPLYGMLMDLTVFELYHVKDRITLSLLGSSGAKMEFSVPINQALVKYEHKERGTYRVGVKQTTTGGIQSMTLTFNFDTPQSKQFDTPQGKRYKTPEEKKGSYSYELRLQPNGDIHVINPQNPSTHIVYYPL